MYTKIYRSISEIEEDQWNSIVGKNRIICSYRFLLAVEKSNINDCKYFYPVVYDYDKIVAHACSYSISMKLDIFAEGIAKKIINIIRKVWKNFLIIKLFECGTPIALGNTISFADKIDKNIALLLLINEIENIAVREKSGLIVIRDFYENEIDFFDNLIKKKYKKVYNLPNTMLKVKWKSFDEYLKEMRSHYKQQIRKYINIAKTKNLTIEVCENFSDLSEYLQILWRNVYNNAKEYKREILTKEFFMNMDTYFGKRSKVILLKKDFQIIGHGLLLSDDDTLIAMFCGLDYNYNKEFSVYFNFLYYIVKQAINEGKREIDIGMSTYIPKLKIGAEMKTLYMYMKHTNKLLNPIMTNLFNILNPQIKIKTYNVFKEKIENKFAINSSIIHN